MVDVSRAPVLVAPGSFEPERHFYPRVLNAHIHPVVRFLFGMGNERIAARYCHLHPEVVPEAVARALSYEAVHFRWGGADLLHVSDEHGHRRMVVIETNSCPSGQKSMPLVVEGSEQGGYRRLLEDAFLPLLDKRRPPPGALAVLFDKNEMEASGYAAALADLAGEPVWLVPVPADAEDLCARFDESRVLHVRVDGDWIPIKAAFRYVTQRPWDRIPAVAKTLIFNPVLACLAGGRNKLLAAKAYDFFNGELAQDGLQIQIPETMWDVSKREIPLWIQRMGGRGVVKVPYANAGQGVYVITRPDELDAVMDREFRYDRFVVQGLVGNSEWTSRLPRGSLYHVGTVPDRRNAIFVADVRFMVGASERGFFPVAIYGRRARAPMERAPPLDSWSVLGTNLSVRGPDGAWTTEPERLLLTDSRDFNRLGAGLDDLIDAYVQTVLAVTAIDRLCDQLVTTRGKLKARLFRSLNPDDALLAEIMP